MGSRNNTKYDLVIVGGGGTGLYCADRVVATHPDWKVGVFEASGRFGGRLLSLPSPANDRIAMEMGAGYIGNAHENVWGLTERFGLGRVPVSFAGTHDFLRGRVLSDEMYADPGAVPFRLPPDEAGQHPRALLPSTLARIVPKMQTLWPFETTGPLGTPTAAAQYLRDLRVGGLPLNECGLWNLLSDTGSNEKIELLAATHGSVAAFRNSNAYDAIWTLICEMNPNQDHFMVEGGYQRLAEALLRANADAATFAPCKRLAEVKALTSSMRLNFDTPAGDETVEAERVILALPKRALEDIKIDEAIVGDQFYADLAAVQSVPAVKAYFVYDKPWWNGADRPIGASPVVPVTVSSTDLPLRQVYYFAAAADGPGVIMMFADDVTASYWTGLNGACDGTLRASDALIGAAHRQLQQMHPSVAITRPRAAWFKAWHAGWHAWTPHVRSWELRKSMHQPNLRLAFHLCGEAFASLQGWVEGGLNDAEVMLQKHFGVPHPWWVRRDYVFQP
jgi:monoamine oxidase